MNLSTTLSVLTGRDDIDAAADRGRYLENAPLGQVPEPDPGALRVRAQRERATRELSTCHVYSDTARRRID